jgi:hypothetical protein
VARIFKYDQAAVDRALARIHDGVDHGSQDQRPVFDPKERAEALARAADGRTPESFQTVLRHYGFRFYAPAHVARVAAERGLAPMGMPGEASPEVEGQWRSKRFLGGTAFTPSDLIANFSSPEAFDAWARKMELKQKLERRRVGKAEIRIATSRS